MLGAISRFFGSLGRGVANAVTSERGLLRFLRHPRVIAILLAVAARLSALNPFRKRKPPPPIMRPYVDLRRPLRRIGRIIFPIALFLFCFIYGFFYALTAPYLLLPFTVPIVVLMLLSIWALPDTPHAPLRTLEWLFASVIIARVLWPNYLALQLPGMPWITALRLFGFPMGFILMISLSTSPSFRSDVWQSIRSIPGLSVCFIGLATMNFVTLPLSKEPAASMQAALLDLIFMVGMILIGSWIARTQGRAKRYVELLMWLSVPIMALTLVEFRNQGVLWNGHVPQFLKVNDPAAIRAMSDSTRGTNGLYRTKATFTTALGLAEYLAILTPFFIYYTFRARGLLAKAMNAMAIPVLFFCIFTTNARLGMVGFLVSLLVYLLFWGIARFARDRRDLTGAAVVYGYPAMAAAALGVVLSVHRLRVLILGDGSQASSNEARQSQLSMGIPKIFENPIGHGAGESGASMGYAAGDFITIDNYYLTISLDNGIVGLVTFIGIFASTISAAVGAFVKHPNVLEDRELGLLLPISVSFSAFLVIKLVFSQPDNHMLLFALAGIAAGLMYRAKQSVTLTNDTAAPASSSLGSARSQPASSAGALPGKRLRPAAIDRY